MNSIKLFIAENKYLFRQGLRKVFEETPNIDVVGECATGETLATDIHKIEPDALIINYATADFSVGDVLAVMKSSPAVKVIGITSECKVDQIKQLVKSGISGHLMNDCDHDEIVDSILCSAKGERFFCGKILDKINESEGESTQHGCDPVSISERELEILHLVAEGLTTKQIAEKLHLSFHTVMTHRKNMMGKLGINNTAGLIIYAVKENLISPNRFLFSGGN
jgi:DNA-binding NarL/FixJ family response regulator